MKVIKESRQCVSCRETNFGRSSAFSGAIPRILRTSAVFVWRVIQGTISNAEIRQLEKELKKCAKRRHTYTKKLEELTSTLTCY
jgi:hypothetical protein